MTKVNRKPFAALGDQLLNARSYQRDRVTLSSARILSATACLGVNHYLNGMNPEYAADVHEALFGCLSPSDQELFWNQYYL